MGPLWKLGLRRGHSQEVEPGWKTGQLPVQWKKGIPNISPDSFSPTQPTRPIRISRSCSSPIPTPAPILLTQDSLWGSALPLGNRGALWWETIVSLPSVCFPFRIWVMVTPSEALLPGECSRTCKKLFSQAERRHFFYLTKYLWLQTARATGR